jgi:hypothetical protein
MPPSTRPVPSWRSVGVPREHGGWGLTLEPVLLGLLVAFGPAGALLGLAAFVAFVARTPLKVVLVDARRGHQLERTVVARRLLVAEGFVLVALVAGAAACGDARMWVPLVVAAPLVVLELWFDMRSRSRRLVPEVAGAIGVASVVAMIVLADGGSASIAVALWLVLTARAATSIPFVRDQVAHLHGHRPRPTPTIVGDLAALVVAIAAVAVDPAVLVGGVAVVVLVGLQRLGALRPPSRATILGVQQLLLGLALVAATAVGVHLA